MAGKVLVGYATQYGSTKEVAEAIAETLRENGLEVDLQPLNKVRTLRKLQRCRDGSAAYYVPLAQGRAQLSIPAPECFIGTPGGDLCARADAPTPRCSRVEGFAGTA